MLDPLQEAWDDYFFEDLPFVLAGIGGAAVDPAAAYLNEGGHEDRCLIAAASSLAQIAHAHPDLRGRVITILEERLTRHDHGMEAVNGFIVADLIELKSVESAEVIERAYAAGAVDLEICGGWSKVREELGVEGLGLVDEEAEAAEWERIMAGRRAYFRDSEAASKRLALERSDQQQKNRERKQKKQKRKQKKRGRR